MYIMANVLWQLKLKAALHCIPAHSQASAILPLPCIVKALINAPLRNTDDLQRHLVWNEKITSET